MRKQFDPGRLSTTIAVDEEMSCCANFAMLLLCWLDDDKIEPVQGRG
jgi:hypothetical protein